MQVPTTRYRQAVATVVAGIVVALATAACGGADEEPPGRFDPGVEPAQTPEEFEPFDEEGG